VAVVDDGYLSLHKNARFLAGIFYVEGGIQIIAQIPAKSRITLI
jgi:hypothetical protein